MQKYQARSRWSKMLSRCEDEDHPQYHDYGGRGIVVCDEWHDFNTFYDWCLSNITDSSQQIDRIDNGRGYDPGNCRFVTRSENARNKRNNVVLTAFSESKTMIEWSEDGRCAVDYRTLLQRNLRGWDHEKAITTPPDGSRKGRVAPNAKLIEAWGELKTIAEWLKDDRCVYKSRQGVWERINKHGWTSERAMTQPPGRGRPKKS